MPVIHFSQKGDPKWTKRQRGKYGSDQCHCSRYD